MTSTNGSERFLLPRPKRAVWMVVVVVGIGTALLGAAALVENPLDGLPVAYIALGAGLFLACFAVAMLMVRERASILEIGPATLGIETLGRETVSLPWRSLRQAVVLPQGDGHELVVALRKADGGWVELAAFGDEEAATNLAAQLQSIIDAPPEGTDASVPTLDGLEGIAARRDGERTELTWSTTSFGGLMALGPIGGLFVIVYGFHLNEPSYGTLAGMGVSAALGVLAVVFTLVNVGAEQRLVLDPTTLTISRTRLGKEIDRKELELRAIAAVDYTHRLNVLGASSLTIRTDQTRLQQEGIERRVAEEAPDLGDIEAIGLSAHLLKAIAGGIHVPLGRLPLSTRIGLDLALSEEIARRSLRAEGTV